MLLIKNKKLHWCKNKEQKHEEQSGCVLIPYDYSETDTLH